MNNFINCQGYARIGMISVLIGAVTNIILDPILMFIFHMGVEGAAMASVISQLFSCIFVMTVLLSKHLPVRLKFMGIDIKTLLGTGENRQKVSSENRHFQSIKNSQS